MTDNKVVYDSITGINRNDLGATKITLGRGVLLVFEMSLYEKTIFIKRSFQVDYCFFSINLTLFIQIYEGYY